MFDYFGERSEFGGGVISDEILFVRSKLASNDVGSGVSDQALYVSLTLTTICETHLGINEPEPLASLLLAETEHGKVVHHLLGDTTCQL